MQPQLISHSPDLQKLWEAGYDMEINGGQHLLVHQVPYVTAIKEIKYGTLVCILTLRSATVVGKMPDHTAYFTGEIPCDVDGNPLNAIIISSTAKKLSGSVAVNFQFSSKPKGGSYADYYEKVRTYVEILSAQAKAIDPTVTAQPYKQRI